MAMVLWETGNYFGEGMLALSMRKLGNNGQRGYLKVLRVKREFEQVTILFREV